MILHYLCILSFNPDPTDRHTVWGLIIGCNFTWLAVYGVSQAMVQRYLTLPSEGKARAAIWINLPGDLYIKTIHIEKTFLIILIIDPWSSFASCKCLK